MKRLLIPVVLLSAVMAFISVPAKADPLDGLIGKKRVVILFAKSRSQAALDRLVDNFRELRFELDDRDTIVLVSAGTDDVYGAIGYFDLPRGAYRGLRRRFKPDGSGLMIVLVGKNGSEIGRWVHHVDPEEIFDAIDSTPERRKEVQADG